MIMAAAKGMEPPDSGKRERKEGRKEERGRENEGEEKQLRKEILSFKLSSRMKQERRAIKAGASLPPFE